MKKNQAFHFARTGAVLLLALSLFPSNAFAKKICPAPVPIKRAASTSIGTLSSQVSPVTSTGTLRMVQQCYFDDMPIYDQTNPNLAYVSVPDSTYCAEKNPVLQNYFGAQGICDNGVPRVPASPLPPSKSFYKTWLPWGPLTGDPGSAGSFGSATCAANSGAMVMHALVNNKDSSTTLTQGTGDETSWVQDVFLAAAKPAEQEDWPIPLITYLSNNATYVAASGDQNAGRRDPSRMTATDLQQVVNMGSALGTDPTYMTETFWGWFDYYDNFQPQAQTFYTAQTSVETFRNFLSQGYTGIIGIGPVTVHISSTRGGEKVTLEPGDGGHIMAIQGFSSIADYKAAACNYNPITGKTHCTYAMVPGTESLSLSINDPWFANRRTVPIRTLKAGTNQRTLSAGAHRAHQDLEGGNQPADLERRQHPNPLCGLRFERRGRTQLYRRYPCERRRRNRPLALRQFQHLDAPRCLVLNRRPDHLRYRHHGLDAGQLMRKWIVPTLGLALAAVFLLWHFRAKPPSPSPSKTSENPTASSAPSASSDSMPATPEGLFPLNPKLQEKKNELIGKVFSDNDTGRKLADVVVLFNQGSIPEINPKEASRMAFQLAALRKDPEQTFKNLSSNLKNLPPEYAAERQFLLQFASRLDVDKNAIGDFLATEMKTPVTLPEDGSRPLSSFTPLAALDAMIDAGLEPSKIEQALREALEAQTDPAERLLLIGRYERLDKAEAARLMESYSSPPEQAESQP